MLKITFCLLLLGSLTLVSCLPSGESVVVDDSSNDKGGDKDETSTPAGPPEPIDELIEEFEDSLNQLGNKRDEILGRFRRSTHDSSHWCCSKKDPGQSIKRPVLRARIVQKTIQAGTSIKCGLFGWRRCGSSEDKQVTVTEYFTDYEYPSIPAEAFKDGCPDANVVCCKGYYYNKKLGNCITFKQLEELVKLARAYKEELDTLGDFFSK